MAKRNGRGCRRSVKAGWKSSLAMTGAADQRAACSSYTFDMRTTASADILFANIARPMMQRASNVFERLARSFWRRRMQEHRNRVMGLAASCATLYDTER